MSEVPGIWFPQIYEEARKLKPIRDIEKLTGISREEFKSNYAQKSKPFILKRSLSLLSQKDVIAALAKDWKELEIEMRSTNLKAALAYMNRTLTKVKLGDYLKNYWGSNGGYYAGNNPVSDELADRIGLQFPHFYKRSFFNEPRMWLGPKGSVTPLHKDIPDNFAVNYFGVKKWIIFSPADYPFLSMTNPTPEAYPDLGVSLVDVGNPDLAKFPQYSKATPIEFLLKAGEMLYLPAGWGHYVENVEDSLLFNFWLLRDKSPAVLGRDV
jgi:ribosomal protein L16 Arg81 hydroxylase